MGTVNVLEAARLFDVRRVVYTSAKGIYGPVLGEYGPPKYKPIPEDMPKDPQRIYDSAKLMGEQTGLYYANNMGVDVAVLRFATTYGPGKTARHGKMGVTSQIVENPFHGLPFHHPQGGEAKDDFIYNKDFALGIYLATVAEKVPSRVYNIGGGIGLTLNDFADVLRKQIPGADIKIGPGVNFLGMPYPPHGIYDVTAHATSSASRRSTISNVAIGDYIDSLKRMRARPLPSFHSTGETHDARDSGTTPPVARRARSALECDTATDGGARPRLHGAVGLAGNVGFLHG